MFGLEWFFCCLNPLERQVLRATAEALPLTLFLGVPIDVWNTFWLLSPDSTEDRKAAFLVVYMLEIATIDEGGGEEELTVVRPLDLPFWVDASLFVFTPAAACLSGCQQSKPPYAT